MQAMKGVNEGRMSVRRASIEYDISSKTLERSLKTNLSSKSRLGPSGHIGFKFAQKCKI